MLGESPHEDACEPCQQDDSDGWILLSITTYFWSFEAENESVVPVLTFKATFLGTLSNTGFVLLPLFCCFTRIDTWSEVELVFDDGGLELVVVSTLF